MLKLHHDSQLDPRINVDNNFIIYIMIYMRKSLILLFLQDAIMPSKRIKHNLVY